MTLIGDDRIQKNLELDVASFDHADISAEVGMANKKLKFKVLVNHNNGSVAAMEGPKDVTEYMVRFVCDVLRETRPGIRMAVWVTANQLSKRWRNRYVQGFFSNVR